MQDVYNLLATSHHNAFPVITWAEDTNSYDPDEQEEGLATFSGTILRSQLVLLLLKKSFGPREGDRVYADPLVRDGDAEGDDILFLLSLYTFLPL